MAFTVDFHCHVVPPEFDRRRPELARRDRTFGALFPDGAGRLADADTLLPAMDNAGIDHAVAMGFGWAEPDVARAANDYLLRAGRAHPDRLTVFASVNPAWGEPAVTELRRCLDAGAAGVGELHADSQGFDIADADAMGPLMELLAAGDFPITVHASEPVGHQYPGKGSATPERLLRLAVTFPDNHIVMAHLGGGLPFYAAMPEVAAALSNVWYDTAALPFLYRPEAIAAAALTAGGDRILFGSDYPLLSYRRVLNHLAASGMTEAQLALARGGNARALLRERTIG